jgi:KDO2-lipid IV(A) lauroyltransferase
MPDATTPALGAESARARALKPSSILPASLRQDWPVPRSDVHGTRGGLGARIECLAMLAIVGGAGRLPFALRRRIVSALARVARSVDRKHSDAARTFLRQVFGSEIDAAEIERRVLQAYEHLFHVTIDSEVFDRHVPASRIREHFELDFSERVREVVASRRGCIIVSAHLGDWEAGSAILPWIGLDPVYAVVKPPKNKPLSAHLQNLRERRGVRVLPRRGAMRHARAILDAGGSIILLLDQRANHKPVMAPFFGRMARCDRSAGVLLKRLRAPVVMGACFKNERPFSYTAHIPTVIEPAEIVRKTPEEIATRINLEFEGLIRQHPEQYFWLHDRYRDTPAETFDDDADADDAADPSGSPLSADAEGASPSSSARVERTNAERTDSE